MIISPNVNVYLKTTETCNLNCSHCFTSGSQGAKIFFKPKKVLGFFSELKKQCPWVKTVRFLFHGGEPMLAPVEDLEIFYDGAKEIFQENTEFGIQTNLVYPLTEKKREFFKKAFLDTNFGTSWDYDIRFGSNNPSLRERNERLWENNVRSLVSDGHNMTMIVCITRRLVEEKNPREIIEYAASLGFNYILFERVTMDGNAKLNDTLFPSNKEQDEWLYQMFVETVEYKLYEKIGNMLMSEIATAVVNRLHTANRCRVCEQSLITVNADGTLAGCPNTAPKDFWGHIDWSVKENLESKKRLNTIACETQRNLICYSCPAFSVCNGDCHQLAWEGDTCAAPKKIWSEMLDKGEYGTYKKLIL